MFYTLIWNCVVDVDVDIKFIAGFAEDFRSLLYKILLQKELWVEQEQIV